MSTFCVKDNSASSPALNGNACIAPNNRAGSCSQCIYDDGSATFIIGACGTAALAFSAALCCASCCSGCGLCCGKCLVGCGAISVVGSAGALVSGVRLATLAKSGGSLQDQCCPCWRLTRNEASSTHWPGSTAPPAFDDPSYNTTKPLLAIPVALPPSREYSQTGGDPQQY